MDQAGSLVPPVDGRRGWLVRFEPAWLEEQVFALRVPGLQGLPVEASLKAFRYFMADIGAGLDHARREEFAHALFAVAVLMRPGDVVVALDGNVVRLGLVGHGGAAFVPGELRHSVDWRSDGPPLRLAALPPELHEHLTADAPVADVTPAVEELLRLQHLLTVLPGAGQNLLHVEAPDHYEPRPGDPPAVFLAGGITGVGRWQDRAAAVLARAPAVVLNPHRARFPIDDPGAGAEQVAWEQHHLHLPGVLTLFWFPASDPAVTTQPIAMFELGQALGEGRGLVVGADPGYPRQADVHLLCGSARPGLAVHTALDDVLAAALDLLTGGDRR
jgi:hypothetical protein